MPLYEFKCETCVKVHEVMQKFSDPPLAECPDCHGPVSKLISLSSFSLKGSGWYTTDYKRAAPSSPVQASTQASGSSATQTPPEKSPKKSEAVSSPSTGASKTSSS